MNPQELQTLCESVKKIAWEAGQAILEVYQREDFEIAVKSDQSPLTAADQASHEIIRDALLPHNLPILSEEGREIPYAERSQWHEFWLVDPLDGTKEFIKRNGEFTVNIALVQQQSPIMGVIYVPVQDCIYWGGESIGAFKQGPDGIAHSLKTAPRNRSAAHLKVVASRSHLNPETQAFLDALNAPEIVSMGSSLKFMLLAEGQAHFYPRYAPTMEWDTAAAQAILEAAGGSVCLADSEQPLIYNKENLLNPFFLASA